MMSFLSVFKTVALVAIAPMSAGASSADVVRLEVPYVSQVPQGSWVLPWSQACEEASIAMVQYFYEGKKAPTVAEGKAFMERQIAWEDTELKKNQDTDAEETARIIEENADFDVSIEREPDVEGIKDELRKGRPVIALVDMYQLYGEKSSGDSFHVLVINGFDDEHKAFFVQDPAREQAKSYSYERMIGALHDYNPKTKEGDGQATVLFTDGSDMATSANPSLGLWGKIVEFLNSLFS